jgi:excisionase family DNA binding protein
MTNTNKIIFEVVDFELLLARLDRIERKVSTNNEPKSNVTTILPRLKAAEHLGVGITKFDKMVRDGELIYTLVGRTKKYFETDLDEYLNRNRAGQGMGALLPDAKRRNRRVTA